LKGKNKAFESVQQPADSVKKTSPFIKFLIFLAVSILIIGIIIFITVDEKTINALKQINYNYLGLLFLLWAGILITDMLSVYFFSKGANEHLGLWPSFQSNPIRVLFNLITPFNAGGPPAMIYYLRSKKISSGKGSTIIITKMFMLSAVTMLYAMIAFYALFRTFQDTVLLSTVFLITGGIFTILIAFGVISFLYPQFLITFTTKIGKKLHSIHLIKDFHTFKKNIIQETAKARRGFKRYFSRHIWYFLAGTVATAFMHLGRVMLLVVIFKGLGIDIPMAHGIALSAILFFVISFMPTPGGIGFGEGIFVVLFANYVPMYIIGIAMLLWRIFYQYLSSLLGALFAAGHISELLMSSGEKIPSLNEEIQEDESS